MRASLRKVEFTTLTTVDNQSSSILAVAEPLAGSSARLAKHAPGGRDQGRIRSHDQVVDKVAGH